MQYLYLTVALLLVAVALAGLACIGLGAATILNDLVLELRQRQVPSSEPADSQLVARATAAVGRMSARAGIATPTVDVVPLLGRPVPAPQRRSVGTGGLAVTRFTPRRPIGILFARAALTDLSDAALNNLVAHELGHVIRFSTQAGRLRHYAWAIGFLLATLPLAALVVATRSGALVGATAAVALAYLLLQMFWQRREELAADRFAIELTADLAGTEELMRFYEENLRDEPLPKRRLRRAGALLDRRWLATHPEPQQRLMLMRRHLVHAG